LRLAPQFCDWRALVDATDFTVEVGKAAVSRSLQAFPVVVETRWRAWTSNIDRCSSNASLRRCLTRSWCSPLTRGGGSLLRGYTPTHDKWVCVGVRRCWAPDQDPPLHGSTRLARGV